MGFATIALVWALAGCAGGDVEEPPASEEAVSSASSPAASPSASGREPSESNGEAQTGEGEYMPASAEGPAQHVPVPVRPEAMKHNHAAGATAAAEYFWETTDFLEQTGDRTHLHSVSMNSCRYCIALGDLFSSMYDQGYWTTGTAPSVEHQNVHIHLGDSPTAEAYQGVTFSESFVYDPDGHEVEADRSAASDALLWKIALEFDTKERLWKIAEVTHLGGDDD